MASAASIPALVQRLRSGSKVAQLQAAKQLSALARNSAAERSAIVAAGGIAPLVQLVAGGSSKAAQEEAAYILAKLALDHPSSRPALAAAGGHSATDGAASSQQPWFAAVRRYCAGFPVVGR